MSRRVRVIIVDDHPLFREGVAATLEESNKFQVVGQGGSAADAIRLAGEHRPELVLLDLNMLGGGLAAAHAIGEAQPDTGIVVLTVSESEEDVMAVLRAGVRGYVLKGVSADRLVDILQRIADGERYVPPALAARLLVEVRRTEPAANGRDRFTTLEEQILRLAGTGLSASEIGMKLDLEEGAVKLHMNRILGKHHLRHAGDVARAANRPDKQEASPARERVTGIIRHLLEEAGATGLNAQSVADLAEIRGLNLNRNSVSSLLSRMKKNGEVVYRQRRYVLHEHQ